MKGSVLSEIVAERGRQDEQWGGPSHDDQHSQMDWMDYISQQVEKYAKNVITRGDAYMSTPDAHQRFVKIAALAVAALESFDRKNADGRSAS